MRTAILDRPKVLIFIAILLIFVFQPYKVGFEGNHHGWVSSHVLAQITNASPENYFLGYTTRVHDNIEIKHYFDRYPVIFSGIFHLVLSPFWDNVEAYIFVARQLMNVIFVMMGWLIWRIIRTLDFSKEDSLGILFFILSSSLFIKYKDMVHFDQPALVGCLLALNGIVDYEKKKSLKFLVLGALLGPLLGRGYAVIFFLASWMLVRYVFHWVKYKSKSIGLHKVPLLFTLISIPLPALMLVMNIVGESKIRNVPWDETGIVISAQSRLGLKSYANVDKSVKHLNIPSFVTDQIFRAFDFATPYALVGLHIKNYKEKVTHYLSVIPKTIYQLGLLFLLFKFFPAFWRKSNDDQKLIHLILIFGGVLWLIVMRNLAHYHEYVSMYLLGGIITLWIFLTQLMKQFKLNVVRISFSVFLISLLLNFGRETYTGTQVNWQSKEFQKLRSLMKSENLKTAYFKSGKSRMFIDGVPYAQSFFLSGQTLVLEPESADVKVRLGEKKLIIEH